MLDWELYLPPTRFAILLLPLCSLCDDILYCDGAANLVNVGESPNASSDRRRMSAIVEAIDCDRNEADLTIVCVVLYIRLVHSMI